MATVQGMQEAQAALRAVERAAKAGGPLERVVGYVATRLHRYAMSVTHVDSGELKGAHRVRMAGTRAEIYLDPDAVNDYGQRPAEYGVYEHDRGGSHAFYRRTVDEVGQQTLNEAANMLRRYLP